MEGNNFLGKTNNTPKKRIKKSLNFEYNKPETEIEIKKENAGLSSIINSFFEELKTKIRKEDSSTAKIKEKKELMNSYNDAISKEKAEKNDFSKNEENIQNNEIPNTDDNNGNEWEAAGVLETNLLKGEVTVFFDWNKNLEKLILVIFLSFLLIFFAYVGLVFWEKNTISKGKELVDKNRELMVKISEIEGQIVNIDKFKERLELVKYLMDNHIYWTNFFSFIEKITLSNVSYGGSFSGDTGGKYSFNAITDSVSSVLDQIFFLRENEKILEVNMNTWSYGGNVKEINESTTNFNFNIVIDPSIFTE